MLLETQQNLNRTWISQQQNEGLECRHSGFRYIWLLHLALIKTYLDMVAQIGMEIAEEGVQTEVAT